MSKAETLVLVDGALAGDPEARGQLLERLRPRLVLWAASRMSPALRSRMDPEDMAQEILLAVHKDMGGFSGDSKAFMGWTFTVAENRIRDAAEHHGALKRRQIEARSFSQTSPSMAAGRREEIGRLLSALDALSEEHRDVIRLRRLEERDVREIAVTMGRSENAVRILYCRALKALREALGPAG